MKKIIVLALLLAAAASAQTDTQASGLSGDPEAVELAQSMVEAMGGKEIWSQLKSLHFVHRWYPSNRVDSYLEDEILDLTGPRSWVKMKSEIYHRIRAYSPEHNYWSLTNGSFSYGSETSLNAAMERAPYNIYRIARAVAMDESVYEIRLGESEIPGGRQMDFYGPDGNRYGWIVVNAAAEPIMWATTQYRYIFGPMQRYGNLSVPEWAVYGNGSFRYQMVSLTGDNDVPDMQLFQPPEEYQRADS